jgi:hypothetical protein
MSSVNHGPSHEDGPVYVTSEIATPLPMKDVIGRDITGAAYIQGPVQMGRSTDFVTRWATLMVGGLENNQCEPPIIPGALCPGPLNNPYSLGVVGDAAILDNLDVSVNIRAGANIVAQGEVMSRCGSHILSAKKNFDIPHPTKEGWRLRHTCPEGPSNDVYTRGRVKGTEIHLPSYWKGLVDETTLTVTLTPIGSHQDVIIKRWDEEKIYLQSKGNMPIDCFYQIFAERKDGERLIVEYEGETPADYPGNNDEYSVSGYHYDTKENN